MKLVLTYFFVCLLLACSPQDKDEDNSFQPVLFATITGGEAAKNIRLFNAGLSSHPYLETARIWMSENEGSFIELQRNGQEYFGPDEQQVLFAASYHFRVVSENGSEMVCRTIVPPPVSLVTISTNVVSVEAPGTVASILTWTPLGAGYAYAMRLECLENNPQAIDNSPGEFDRRNGLSQLEPQLLLLKDDFTFYGHHRLTVYAFDASLESLYFFDPADFRGLLRNPPDNVTGGKGFVTGVSKFEVDIQINQ
jgi:hypothetical protein